MDQPLDLSHREIIRMDAEESFHFMNYHHHGHPDEVQNAAFLSPFMGQINPMRFLPGFYQESLAYEPHSLASKRTSEGDIRSIADKGQTTKRRKLHQDNRPIVRSVSDECLPRAESSQRVQTFFRPGFPLPDELAKKSKINIQKNDENREGNKSPSVRTTSVIQSGDVNDVTMTEACNDSKSQDTEQQKSEKEKISSYMERLPKKKYWARNFSRENSEEVLKNTKSSTVTAPVESQRPMFSTGSDIISIPTISKDKREIPRLTTTSSALDESSSSSSSHSSLSSFDDCADVSPQRRSPIDHEELKADMMREIDDSYKNEAEKKPSSYLYTTDLDSAKLKQVGIGASTKPGGCRMTALDYLISKTLLQKEDKPYKARNNHIHQIIRGEKPGKLCLMDIVELQVEIGLA